MAKIKKGFVVLSLPAWGVLWAVIALASGAGGPGGTADQALQVLLEGNRRYVEGRMNAYKGCDPQAREKLKAGQKPHSIVLSCSDSRVPPEIIFDQGLGEIFVVRVAGNVPDPLVLGSIEYAAEHLGTPLILVLGHTRCGAVTAAVEAKGKTGGNQGTILNAIRPAVQQARKKVGSGDQEKLVEAAVDENLRLAVGQLTQKSRVIRRLVEAKKVRIVTGKYDLESGAVSWMER